MKPMSEKEKELFQKSIFGQKTPKGIRRHSVKNSRKNDSSDGDNDHHEEDKQPSGNATCCGLDAVAGMDDLKRLVKEAVINVVENPECASVYGLRPPSVLLYGPPGCGKTYFVEKLAEEMGINYYKIVPDDIASPYIHGTQGKIGERFKKSFENAPCILFLDEFDAMVPARTEKPDSANQNDEVNEFLCMLNNASERGVYVIAATNRPQIIDKAVLRSGRIDEKFYVDMPDEKAREALFRLRLSKLPVANNIDYGKLALLTKGYNCSDITYIVSMASREMFNISIKEKGTPYKVITQAQVEEAIARKTPSVSSRDLKEYERLRNEFSPQETGCQPQVIGFH